MRVFSPPPVSTIIMASLALLAGEPVAARQCGSCVVYVDRTASGTYTYRFDGTPFSPTEWEAAANEWTQAFSSAGSNVRVVPSAQGEWTIRLDASIGAWAQTRPQYKLILVNPATLSTNWEFFASTIRHEFGHMVGFGATDCSKADSVMADTQPDEMQGATVSVGCADTRAVEQNYAPPPLPCDTDPGWPGCNSPLLIDVRGDGFKLTDSTHGVMFDIDADGDLDRVGWTRQGTDDAWLAMDRNGNGKIDDGSELFGNFTPTCPGQESRAPNGFEALKFLESQCYGISQQDGVIDPSDQAFGRLLLWRDRDHDGISSADELVPVEETLLRSINTAYRIVERERRRNTIRQASTVVWGQESRRIVDVWLDTQ